MPAIPEVSEKEEALRDHVLQSATKGDPKSVLQSVDHFCWGGRWMMHVGDVKGGWTDRPCF